MQKHPTNANHEKLTYSPEMLYSEWNKIAERFADLIKGGWANETVLDKIQLNPLERKMFGPRSVLN